MNWVLIAVAAILLGYTIAGYSKGFLKIVYSLISWILILVFVMAAAPYIQDYLKNNTNIYNKVISYCEEAIRTQAEKSMEGSGEAIVDLTDSEIYTVLAEMLPETLIEDLKSPADELADSFIQESGIYEKTAVTMADLFLKGISTLAAIILGIAASAFVSVILGVVSKLPLIGTVDHLLGLVTGAANGLLIVWIIFYLSATLCATELGSEIIAQINANEYLMFLYQNNPILSLLA